jgi:hypothetical protein
MGVSGNNRSEEVNNKYKHNPDGTTTIFIESKKYGAKETLIDTEDWEKVKDYRWSFLHSGYAWSRTQGVHIFLHHLVMGKPAKGFVTDHIDGNGLNNCKGNLHHVTRKQNNQNFAMHHTNTSGFRGVSLDKRNRNKKWYASIRKLGTKSSLGYYYTKEEAAEAYDRAVVKYKEIINPERQLNFPHKLQEYLKESQV